MIYANQLHNLSTANYDLNDKAELVDIKTINVNAALSKSDRIDKYIDAVHNPYLFRVGDTAVRIRFGSKTRTLQESVASFLMSR